MSRRPTSLRRAPCAALVVALWICGCSSEAPADRIALWSDEADWVKWPQGWAQAVSLRGERTFQVRGRVDRLRAVALPMAGAATVRLRVGDEIVSRSIDGPTPIDFEVAAAGTATLSSLEGVHLLRPRLVDRHRQGKRIILVVGDTLRFDHVTPELMPEVHRYFADGTRFLQAHSAASWTLPSVAAIFTGKLPTRLRSPDGVLISIPKETPTIASELAAQGYASVAVTANYTVHHENRYSTGFDLFLVPDPKTGQFADAAWINRLALESASWLDDEDLFLYLQYMEPHDPYRNHETGDSLKPPPTGQPATEAELGALRQAYASEVRHLSRQLHLLLAELGHLDLAVLTSDHGEELGDHGGFRHGLTVFEESVHVPLLIRGRGIEARTVAEPVSLVALKDFIVRGGTAMLDGGLPVNAEAFGFGPPRWSSVLDDRRVIYFARAVVPEPAEHPSERWLLETHPRLSFSRLTDATPVAPDPGLIERSIRSLVDQFTGYRRGIYLLFRRGSAARLEVGGAGRDGWIWGDAAAVEISPGAEASLVVEVTEPDPFILVFLPVEEGATPELEKHERVTAWFDEGPPERAAVEVEETLKRLEALGYI